MKDENLTLIKTGPYKSYNVVMVEIFKDLELHQQRSCQACIFDIFHGNLSSFVVNCFYEHLFPIFISKSKAVKRNMTAVGNSMNAPKPLKAYD